MTLCISLALILLALLPRLLNLGQFVTMDEVEFWFDRSEAFLTAIRTGNFAATAITDHPGVTTMWLGAFGIVLRHALEGLDVLRQTTPQLYVALFQLPPAIVGAVAVGVGYILLRTLVPQPVALLGALLWALDPFAIAYSRVLHVDALSGTFMTLSVLAACSYYFNGPRWPMLVWSGVFAALAMTTKSPALILVPVVGAIALYAAWAQPSERTAPLLRSLLVWAVTTVVAAVAIWPALWAAPLAAYQQIRIGYTAEGTQPHQLGNYFLGQSDPAPGLGFYPVAIALRLTPLTLVGLLALPWAWRRVALPAPAQQSLAGLAWFVLAFTLAMSLFAKKFNRYIEPVFPALDILAALGLIWLCAALASVWSRHWHQGVQRAQTTLLGGLVLAAALNAAWWHPYYIVAYNQLLGGARAGAWAFKTGWGEGMDLAAGWLNEQPDITGVLTATTLKPGLQTYLRRGAQSLTPAGTTLPAQSGYVVVYVESAQTLPLPAPFDQFYGNVPPLETIRIHGVDYAWIYAAPPTVDRLVRAQFGPRVSLFGVSASSAPVVGATMHWKLAWNPHASLPDAPMMFAHLIGSDGVRYAQIDLPLPPDQAGRRYQIQDLPLTIPADAPPGQYSLVIGLYNPIDGQRLPLTSPAAADPALDGPHALLLDQITLSGR